MFSFIQLWEDLIDTTIDPSGENNVQYSMIDMEKPAVPLSATTTTNGMNTVQGIVDRAKTWAGFSQNDRLFKDSFGREMVQTSAGQIIPIEKYAQINNISPNDVNFQNARGNLDGKTNGIGTQLGYGVNRAVNWVGQNPLPATLIAAGGIYAASKNRDRIRNFMPNKNLQPAGY